MDLKPTTPANIEPIIAKADEIKTCSKCTISGESWQNGKCIAGGKKTSQTTIYDFMGTTGDR